MAVSQRVDAMPYMSVWITLRDAIPRIKMAGEPDALEGLRLACSDRVVRVQGVVRGRLIDLGSEWWHPNTQIDVAACRIIKGPTTQRLPIRAITHRHMRLGPEDYQTLPMPGNVADDVAIARDDVERIWPNKAGQSLAREPATAPTGTSSFEGTLSRSTQPSGPSYAIWDHVDLITVAQAAALWCEAEPDASFDYQKIRDPKIGSAEQLIVSGIRTGEIPVDHTGNVLSSIGNYGRSMVRRSDLRKFADQRRLKPPFLFTEDRLGTGPLTASVAPEYSAGSRSGPEAARSSIVGEPDPYRTGLPGRPTASHLIMLELQRRIDVGKVLPSLKEEALALQAWFEREHPTAPRLSEKTITNNIRTHYRANVSRNA